MSDPVITYLRRHRHLIKMGKHKTHEGAASMIARTSPRLASEVHDIIGSYPSSEPELRALQKYLDANRAGRVAEPADQDAADELLLATENEGKLYSLYLAICKNLANKKAQGKYDAQKAVKAFEPLTEAGAREYEKWNLSPGQWNKVFNKSTRRLAAADFARKFEVQYREGAFDKYLTKVSAKAKASRPNMAGRTGPARKRTLKSISASRRHPIVYITEQPDEELGGTRMDFVITQPGANAIADKLQSLHGSYWENDGPDFAYNIVTVFSQAERADVLSELHDAGVETVYADYGVPRGHVASVSVARSKKLAREARASSRGQKRPAKASRTRY